MTISGVGKTSSLVTDLTAKGLSSTKAKLVASDLDASVKSVGGGTTALDKAAVRTALDQRISADVASGKLTQKDADAVTKTLDGMADKVANASSTATSASPSTGATAQASGTSGSTPSGAGGGGSGGGSTAKTELSRVVVVSGALETTTITYTDGATETETGSSSGATSNDPSEAAAASAASNKVGESGYTTKLDPGSLVDTVG